MMKLISCSIRDFKSRISSSFFPSFLWLNSFFYFLFSFPCILYKQKFQVLLRNATIHMQIICLLWEWNNLLMKTVKEMRRSTMSKRRKNKIVNRSSLFVFVVGNGLYICISFLAKINHLSKVQDFAVLTWREMVGWSMFLLMKLILYLSQILIHGLYKGMFKKVCFIC